MSDRNTGGSSFGRDIAKSISAQVSKLATFLSPGERAERRNSRQAEVIERAKRMPPKGWKPGQAYIFDQQDAEDSATVLVAGNGAGVRDGAAGGIAGQAAPDSKRPRTQVKPPKRPRNYNPQGRYNGKAAKRPPLCSPVES